MENAETVQLIVISALMIKIVYVVHLIIFLLLVLTVVHVHLLANV